MNGGEAMAPNKNIKCLPHKKVMVLKKVGGRIKIACSVKDCICSTWRKTDEETIEYYKSNGGKVENV